VAVRVRVDVRVGLVTAVDEVRLDLDEPVGVAVGSARRDLDRRARREVAPELVEVECESARHLCADEASSRPHQQSDARREERAAE
jgi:hypothetical protein